MTSESYFLTAVIPKEDLKSNPGNFYRNTPLLKRQYPLGWAFFKKENVQKILRGAGLDDFSEIQGDMQRTYQLYGHSENIRDLSFMNRHVIEIIKRRKRRYEIKQFKAASILRAPIVANLLKNPENVAIREKTLLRAKDRHPDATDGPIPSFLVSNQEVPEFLPSEITKLRELSKQQL